MGFPSALLTEKNNEINRLRARVETLESAIRTYRSEMDNPVRDAVMTTTTRRKLFSLIPEV